jgi:hypothetical protein
MNGYFSSGKCKCETKVKKDCVFGYPKDQFKISKEGFFQQGSTTGTFKADKTGFKEMQK